MSASILVSVREGWMLVVALLASIALTSCSHPKTASAEDLSSSLSQAISLASESENFIDYFLQGRSTVNYGRAHLEYLLDEAAREAKQLHESAPEAATRQSLPQCQKQLDSLVACIRFAGQKLDDGDHLRVAKQQLDDLQKALKDTRSSL